MVSTIEIKSYLLRRGEVVYIAALVETKPNMYQKVPNAMAHVLEKFTDIMLAKFSK